MEKQFVIILYLGPRYINMKVLKTPQSFTHILAVDWGLSISILYFYTLYALPFVHQPSKPLRRSIPYVRTSFLGPCQKPYCLGISEALLHARVYHTRARHWTKEQVIDLSSFLIAYAKVALHSTKMHFDVILSDYNLIFMRLGTLHISPAITLCKEENCGGLNYCRQSFLWKKADCKA